MAEVVVFPKVGLTAREGILTEWLVEIGEQVEAGDPLCEIETDKVTNEVESPFSGVLLQRMEPGATVLVGAPIALIGEPGEEAEPDILGGGTDREQPDTAPDEPSGSRAAPLASAGERAKASPSAKRRAAELGLGLAGITGSGPGGRITTKDVERAAGAQQVGSRSEEPSKLRRAIAEAMSRSALVPQFSLERDVDVAALREALEESGGVTIADVVGMLLGRAIRRQEAFRRAWVDGVFQISDGVHIGVAVAVEDGLVVPVVRDADAMTARMFAAVRRDLQERAVSGRLAVHESSGAVFSLSNLGPFGVDRFRALVNPPESGILALGCIRTQDDRAVLSLSLSADHRVADGAQGAQLLAAVAEGLQAASGFSEILGERTGD